MFEQLNMLNDAAVFIYKSLGIKSTHYLTFLFSQNCFIIKGKKNKLGIIYYT